MLTPAQSPPSTHELVAHVSDWLDLLAHGQLAEACQALDGPDSYGRTWTPGRFISVLVDTFPPGSVFRDKHPAGPVVTPVASASGNPAVSVVALGDGSGYSVEYAVPLNEEFSELTAQLEFQWNGDSLSFVLQDLHVL